MQALVYLPRRGDLFHRVEGVQSEYVGDGPHVRDALSGAEHLRDWLQWLPFPFL